MFEAMFMCIGLKAKQNKTKKKPKKKGKDRKQNMLSCESICVHSMALFLLKYVQSGLYLQV